MNFESQISTEVKKSPDNFTLFTASHMANFDWPFRTLPFGFIGGISLHLNHLIAHNTWEILIGYLGHFLLDFFKF